MTAGWYGIGVGLFNALEELIRSRSEFLYFEKRELLLVEVRMVRRHFRENTLVQISCSVSLWLLALTNACPFSFD